MREDILHFVWRYSPFSFNGLRTAGGETIEVIDAGEHNADSGPDFINARIRIGDTLWAGNVEMHIKSSDWYAHNHQTDKAYDNVVLHVVTQNDKPADTSKGNPVPTLVVKYPDLLEWKYLSLTGSTLWIPCADHFGLFDRLTMQGWMSNLMVERLEQKSLQVRAMVAELGGSWEEAFYQAVSRSFGLKLNALPFELLAKSTPLRVLAKHKNSLFQLEALLFGQAGMLSEAETEDEYWLSLRVEYHFLKKKYGLQPLEGHLWKFMRMRPIAFPTIRIAQLACLINQSTSLFSKAMEAGSMEEIARCLRSKTSAYWETHYVFGKPSPQRVKPFGPEATRTVTLNAVIPFMFAYGTARGKAELKEKALDLLESVDPESNSITRGFSKLGVAATSAFESQALIHLKNSYCDKRMCIYCQLGARILLKETISLGNYSCCS